jgi:hypothetical protein
VVVPIIPAPYKAPIKAAIAVMKPLIAVMIPVVVFQKLLPSI